MFLYLVRYQLLAFICLCLCPSTPAGAIGYRIGVSNALMQQPTSQYFHWMYGVYSDVFNPSESIILRLQYLERPEFRAVGYRDKEYAGFVSLGTRITAGQRSYLSSFLGFGGFAGYIKPIADETLDTEGPDRKYDISGLSVAAFFNHRIGRVDVAFGVQSFAGFSNQTQVEAYVAWPYNMILINGGYRW